MRRLHRLPHDGLQVGPQSLELVRAERQLMVESSHRTVPGALRSPVQLDRSIIAERSHLQARAAGLDASEVRYASAPRHLPEQHKHNVEHFDREDDRDDDLLGR